MEEQEKTMEVIEDEITDEALQQFIFDDNQLEYYNEYENVLISNI